MTGPNTGSPARRWGTEVSFRLESGTGEEARSFAADLAAAAAGCARHVLFLNEEAGEYGCLAEWARLEDAVAFADRPATLAALARLEARTGKPARVRRYVMEEYLPRETGAYHREHADSDAGRHGGGPDRPGAG